MCIRTSGDRKMKKINKGYKVFISYKYKDSSVWQLPDRKDVELGRTTARNYVDIIQEYFEDSSHINKGEKDGEDLSDFKEDTIASKLRDKIYDSRVTIVLISPNMRNMIEDEDDQWIPWEIRYSLREPTRGGRTSHRNALLGVVLPDVYAHYSYAVRDNHCGTCSCVNYPLTNSFSILKELVLNRKTPNLKEDCIYSKRIFQYPHSYMHMVKWEDFLSDIDKCLDEAVQVSESACEWNMPKLNV